MVNFRKWKNSTKLTTFNPLRDTLQQLKSQGTLLSKGTELTVELHHLVTHFPLFAVYKQTQS